MASPPRTPRRTSGYSEVPLPLNIVTGAIPQLLNDFETFVNAANASRQSVLDSLDCSPELADAIDKLFDPQIVVAKLAGATGPDIQGWLDILPTVVVGAGPVPDAEAEPGASSSAARPRLDVSTADATHDPAAEEVVPSLTRRSNRRQRSRLSNEVTDGVPTDGQANARYQQVYRRKAKQAREQMISVCNAVRAAGRGLQTEGATPAGKLTVLSALYEQLKYLVDVKD